MKEVKENKRALVTTQNDKTLQNTNNDRKICLNNTMVKSMSRCIKCIVSNNQQC